MALLNVEIVYALPEKQTLLAFQVDEGITLDEAIALSGIQTHYPVLDFSTMKVGLFGKVMPRTYVMREKDRIEIYRPLLADPKEVRKRRAAEGKAMKKGVEKQ